MWKIAVGFAVFAALALFVIVKGGDSLDMTGEKHGADAVACARTRCGTCGCGQRCQIGASGRHAGSGVDQAATACARASTVGGTHPANELASARMRREASGSLCSRAITWYTSHRSIHSAWADGASVSCCRMRLASGPTQSSSMARLR